MLSLLSKVAQRRPLVLVGPSLRAAEQKIGQNVVSKRWSGHNAMDIEPSNYSWKEFKDICHFYFIIAAIPISVITTIINIRANPELTEIPEGYEPRHWEYYKHPITRWMAKYMFMPMETEDEVQLDFLDKCSQETILSKINRNVNKVQRFYADHRSLNFRPHHDAAQVRKMRDEQEYGFVKVRSYSNEMIEVAHDPYYNPVPTEGYPTGEYKD